MRVQILGYNNLILNAIVDEYVSSAASGTAAVASVIPLADVAGSLSGKSFKISTPTKTFVAWFNVDGGSTSPAAGPNEILVPVAISAGDNAEVIADAVTAALDAKAELTAENDAEATAEIITVTTPGGNVLTGGDYWSLSSPTVDYTVWYEVTNTAFPEITEVTVPAVTGNIVGGDYWTLSDPTTDYYVWYTVQQLDVAEVTEVTLPAVTGNIVGADYWTLSDPTTDYYVYYTVQQPDEAEVTEITLPAATGISAADYWTLHDGVGAYYVWYTLDAAGADPSPGGTGIGPVAVVTGDLNSDVATKTAAAIAAVSGSFTCPVPGAEVITVTNVTAAAAADAAIGVGVTGISFNLLNDGVTGTPVGADPAPGGTPIVVALLEADTNAEVATKTAFAINAIADFGCPAPGAAVITITNANQGAADDAAVGVGVTGISFNILADGETNAAEGADPTPGGTGIPVALLEADTDAEVATKTASAIDGIGDFGATPTAEVVEITNANDGVVDPAAVGVGVTGISFNITQTGEDAVAAGVDPAIAGTTAVPVSVTEANTDVEVAIATAAALNALPAFNVPVPGIATLVITNADTGNVPDADGNSVVTIVSTQGVSKIMITNVAKGAVAAPVDVGTSFTLANETPGVEGNGDITGTAFVRVTGQMAIDKPTIFGAATGNTLYGTRTVWQDVDIIVPTVRIYEIFPD